MGLTVSGALLLYAARPRQLAALDFGEWFVRATEIKDDALRQLNTVNAQRHVEEACYLNDPQIFNKINAYHDYIRY